MKAFVLALCLLPAFAFAQAPPTQEQTNSDQRQTNTDQARTNTDQTATNTASTGQVSKNTNDIVGLTETARQQDFILKLITILVGLSGSIISAVVLVHTTNAKTAAEARATEQRDNLILIARSINGVRTELVARSELAAFLEGVKQEGGKTGGKVDPELSAREKELTEALRVATEKSRVASEKAEEALIAKDSKNKGDITATGPPTGPVVEIQPGQVKTLVGTKKP